MSNYWHDCTTFIFECFLVSGVPGGDAFICCDGVYGGRGAHRRRYRDRYEGMRVKPLNRHRPVMKNKSVWGN